MQARFQLYVCTLPIEKVSHPSRNSQGTREEHMQIGNTNILLFYQKNEYASAHDEPLVVEQSFSKFLERVQFEFFRICSNGNWLNVFQNVDSTE